MQEYYIRSPDSEESRGPFSIEQLASLGETGHVTPDTYVYDPGAEEWLLLGEHEELRAAVFPERKRLTTAEKAEFESLNEEEAGLPPITVDELLLAAEGNTEETREKKKEDIWREKAEVAVMYVLGSAFVLSAIGLFLAQRHIFSDFSFGAALRNPLIIVGAFDLGLALVLFLQTTAAHPLIRFRMMLGSGFALFFFWAVGHPLIGVVVLIGSLGICSLTLFLKKIPFLISSAVAILGMIGFVILTLGV